MNHSIILTTANARYSHTSLGLRCIYANLAELQARTKIIEWTLKDPAATIASGLLKYKPKIIGLGIYIWNIDLLTETILLLKASNPEIIIILGGPEISYTVSDLLLNQADYILQLEGEETFKNICRKLLVGDFPSAKIMKSPILDTLKLPFPYAYYTDQDIKNRKIYVEASRGCAFKCHFCLSSMDDGIRNFNINLFLIEIKKLYQKGVRQFKFIDRTFNLDIKLSAKILNFFYEEFKNQDFFLHFEVIPDRLPQDLKEHILKFSAGMLQFEVGIQTFDKAVSKRIGRKQNKAKALENLSFLRHHTHAHLHVDLIIGLPGASIEIFKQDLNQLVSIGLQEVQIGMLKNLKGTPLHQHIKEFQLDFTTAAPYEIISTIDIDKQKMKQLRNFQKFWDKYYNSGNFKLSMLQLFSFSNPYDEFFALADYAYNICDKTFGISLDQLCEILYHFLTQKKSLTHSAARELILKDILRKKGRKIPKLLKDYSLGVPLAISKSSVPTNSLGRQANALLL